MYRYHYPLNRFVLALVGVSSFGHRLQSIVSDDLLCAQVDDGGHGCGSPVATTISQYLLHVHPQPLDPAYPREARYPPDHALVGLQS